MKTKSITEKSAPVGTKQELLASENKVRLTSTPPFKLQPKENKNWQAFDLQDIFGYLPRVIVISKLPKPKNMFVLSAVLPKE